MCDRIPLPDSSWCVRGPSRSPHTTETIMVGLPTLPALGAGGWDRGLGRLQDTGEALSWASDGS